VAAHRLHPDADCYPSFWPNVFSVDLHERRGRVPAIPQRSGIPSATIVFGQANDMQTSMITYMLILIMRRWTWLAAGAAGAMVVAAALLLTQSLTYVATVSIVPTRARTEVNYDTRIRTLSSDSSAQNGQPSLSVVTPERRQALAQLVRSLEIETDVRAKLGDRLPEALRTPGRLTRLVQGRVIPRSEIIAIDISAPNAALADDIASAWSEAYERRVNDLYGASPSGTRLFEAELAQAKQNYQAADSVFTAFLATSQLAEYTRSLESKQRLLKELLSLRQSRASDLYKIALRVDLLLSQAEALEQQLNLAQDNGAAATSAAALTVIKTQAFASSMILSAGLEVQLPRPPQEPQGGTTSNAQLPVPPPVTGDPTSDLAAASHALQEWSLPANVQIQVPTVANPTLAQQRSDIATTINALRDWRARIGKALQEGPAPQSGDGVSTVADIDQTIVRLEAEVRDLQSKVADQGSQLRGLQQGRDVLWESYSSLLKKTEEGRVADLVGSGKEVSIAGRTGAEPKSRRLFVLLPLAGLLGALAVAGAIVTRAWYSQMVAVPDARSNGAVIPDEISPKQGARRA
jgi:hypothetical protein